MQIIVSINQPPASDTNAQTRWQNTVNTCETLIKQKGFATDASHTSGTWLLTSQSMLPILGIVLFHAEENKQTYQLSVMDERFSWKSGPGGFSSASVFGGDNSKK
jgi:phosphoglycerol transferase MdoB-like AlkP superfamily enzyme